jgi:hypothetical protein
MMEEYMHGLHTVEKHKQDKYVKPIFAVKNIPKELSKKETDLLRTAAGGFKNVVGKKDKNNKEKKGKVKESQIWEMSYLKSFDDLEFI